jgi:hypothetical protein
MFKPLKYCKHPDVGWCWQSPNDIEFCSGGPFSTIITVTY